MMFPLVECYLVNCSKVTTVSAVRLNTDLSQVQLLLRPWIRKVPFVVITEPGGTGLPTELAGLITKGPHSPYRR